MDKRYPPCKPAPDPSDDDPRTPYSRPQPRCTPDSRDPACSTTGSSTTGRAAEQRSADWLQQRGCQIIARNHHCRYGELDLVVLQGETLVFVEVRSRGNSRHGHPYESVDRHKQKKLIAAAQDFLQRHPEHAWRNCRFDIIGICQDKSPTWLQNAFICTD